MENQNIAKSVEDLALKSAEPKQITALLPDGSEQPMLLTSKNLQVHDLSEMMDRPKAIESCRSLNKPQGFIEYINDFKGESSCIFGSPESFTPFVAVLDYHSKEKPSWCHHKCELALTSTTPWLKWTRSESSAMRHKDFINFIKDNVQDVTSPDHAGLIESIMQFESDLKVKSKSTVSGHGESNTLERDFKTSAIPEIIKVGLAPFRYLKHYEAVVRVSVKQGERGVEFAIQITNKDRILEAVFDDLVDMVSSETGLKVYV